MNSHPAGGSILAATGLSVRYPRSVRPVLRDIEMTVRSGEVVGLTGHSGSGKTSLLHAVAGLIPWVTPARVTGGVVLDGEPVDELDPGQRAHLIATCLDRPEAQLFLATVGQELGAARRLYGGNPFLDEVVDGLALRPLLARRVTELSSGERQRVALAVTLAGCPRPVLLDEPTAHLDSAGEAVLVDLLIRAREMGTPVVLTEQAGWRVEPAVSDWYEVGEGRLGRTAAPRVPVVSPLEHDPGAETVLRCRGVRVVRGGRTLVDNVDLDLREREVVLLSGPNGGGKSTFARVLAGLTAPGGGEIRRTLRVGLMLPESDLQLFASTVAGEVSVAGTSQGERARVLRRHRLDHLAARAPWSLSRGEQQRLVHASLDIRRPGVMIVDEPAQGLDSRDVSELLELVHRRSAKGRAYVIISHRPELGAFAHRHLVLEGGRVEEVEP